ncbi:uncharacterized protein LOC126567764 isoform X1 [Anopheles maculipalpis]|uniref:uncharacterized protein LOC126567764 isoform X1 n=1 Tax=Anopheles maculipalpis TaxID=1496333 RepID=UPI0021591CCE|nr:uncharacterized protein LOC126567764 isoform X1 [Anopheles maculipalpis]
MADQGQTPPITSAPKRSTDHPATIGMPTFQHMHGGSESCKNSPNVPRRHDPAHHLPHHGAALLLHESGSQSAKSSPLPNRRLDKLQGVIRDQRSTPIAGRRAADGSEMEAFESPLVSRRFLQQQQQPCECVGGVTAPPAKRRAASECMCSTGVATGGEPQLMRKRVDSDCGSAGSCLRKNVVRHNFGLASGAGVGGGLSSCENSPLPVRRPFAGGVGSVVGGPVFPASPAKSVLGEPGVFSSPIHRPYAHHHAAAGGFHGPGSASPAKSVMGEPGVFSSPARSVICSPPGADPRGGSVCGGDGMEDMDLGSGNSAGDVLAGDQTIVSGWLKFRDNKKWKIRWGVVTKLSPAADCLHLQLYRDSKDRYKNGQTKASLSLQHFLGVESGFTLDKESNTIAIICQDVIVVLAFDTRERLIQWQVKISNNLGDDLQYLVLVSSAPPKAKLSTGPARMHIQDHRFCLTTGVPPRLTGLWQIEHLRRYGVVDNRFCFEGGSSCGKGEGLYVFVTDLGEEITHTFKLASQGKLANKKRATAKKIAALDSPRKGAESRSTNYNDEICTVHIENSNCTCRNSYWPSTESRDLDSNYGCGDTASVSECHDSINDLDSFPRNTVANLERCMSCISKLGAPSMSRSSTVTGTPGAVAPLPAWHMLTEHNNHINQTHKLPPPQLALDRMSLCSHGSSNNSEYSIPRQACGAGESSWYEKAPSQATVSICSHHNRSTSPCSCSCPSVPCRPPKPRDISLHITAPIHTAISMSTGKTPQQHSVGPYENYDIPKTPIAIDGSSSTGCTPGENYDTPKKIQEYLAKEGKDLMDGSGSGGYGNYDMPMSLTKAVCSCLSSGGEAPIQPPIKGPERVDCTCHRVMSWADNWISLPLCKRGNGIENTTVQVNKVKLSGEGKMPVMDASGAGDGSGAIYATVDMTKKIRKKLEQACACDEPLVTQPQASGPKQLPASCYDNYEDVEIKPEAGANYANLEFERSLENYENSKEVLQRAGLCLAGAPSDEEEPRVCHKCGHPSAKTPDADEDCRPDGGEQASADDKQENYMMMEPGNKKSKFPGYIPMSPAAPSSVGGVPESTDGTVSPTAPPLPSKSDLLKQRMSRIIGEKSASNPSLCGPAVDRSRKRIDDESRVPGSAMLRATLTSPYARKQLMDSSDLLPTCAAEKRLSPRKRSASAESSRFLDAEGEEIESPLSGTASPSTETLLRKTPTPGSTTALRRSSSPCVHQEMESSEKTAAVAEAEDDLSASTNPASSQTSQSVYIRRSESVPCKAQNRDSSSSNDSGVSTGSLRQRGTDFTDFELPLTTAMSARRHQRHVLPTQNCVHASLPRRSKSFDPLRELSFQFQKIRVPEKSTSAEAEVPVCPPKAKDVMAGAPGAPYIDSRSTSSGTSDMSDYIETLSLSSHSSSDTPEGMRHIRQATSTLRPRSGKEYQNIDRSILSLTQASADAIKVPGTPSQLRGLLSCSANYANITPVPENAESPSPGYQSGTSPQDAQGQHFMFKNSS